MFRPSIKAARPTGTNHDRSILQSVPSLHPSAWAQQVQPRIRKAYHECYEWVQYIDVYSKQATLFYWDLQFEAVMPLLEKWNSSMIAWFLDQLIYQRWLNSRRREPWRASYFWWRNEMDESRLAHAQTAVCSATGWAKMTLQVQQPSTKQYS